MKKLTGFLRLMRPANIVTAVSDILAGIAIAYSTDRGDLSSSLCWLILATVGLYGGGVVFNDVFDAELDRVERPERPIPSGLISKTEGALLGSMLLLVGIVAALWVSALSGVVAIAIAAAALVYDKWGKHHNFFGPVNMGLCRGLNLLLGMSFVPLAIPHVGFLALVPILYIAAITMISRGEVHGGKSNTILAAAGLYGIVILAIATFSFLHQAYYAFAFLALLVGLIFPPLVRAFRAPIGPNIGKAVKAGVLALIVMNASWVAATGVPGAVFVAVGIVLLLPVSIALAKLFAVT